jgi:hypothetical protein
MGFRPTFVTDDCSYVWPQWFRDKYQNVHFPDERGPISSKREAKCYQSWDENFIADIQKCLIEELEREKDRDPLLTLMFLHECGGVTRYQIGPYSILISEPQFWGIEKEVTHMYCYDCSVARDDLNMPEDYSAIIKSHKDRADAMERSRDALMSDFQQQLNAKIADFIRGWNEQKAKA